MKRNVRSFVVLLLVLVSSCFFAPPTKAPLVHVDFESDAVGPYSPEMTKHDWETLIWNDLYDRAHIILEGNAASNKALRITYPAGAVGPTQGGGQFVVSLPQSKELWLSYRVKFGEGFDFTRGGKLPGLTSGGEKYTGGNIPKDGDGWSARYMWQEDGKAVIYLYYVDMPGIWGQSLPLDGAAFLRGQWHQLVQHIRVNAPAQSNGVLEVWFDGNKALSRSDIRFRIGKKGLIDSMYFSTFHGGDGKEYAPTVDCFASFDDFTISKEPPDSLLDQLPDKKGLTERHSGTALGLLGSRLHLSQMKSGKP